MEENFYKLLELDPRLQDTASIEQRIEQKRREWSTQRNDPRLGQIAQKYLTLLPEIRRRLVEDTAARKKQAQDYDRWLHNLKDEIANRLKELAPLLVKNGKVSPQSLALLLKKKENQIFYFDSAHQLCQKPFDSQEALRILNAGIGEEEAPPISASLQKWIDTSELPKVNMGKIRRSLDMVKKKDLFEFLSASPTSHTDLLQKNAEACLADAERLHQELTGARNSPENDARRELIAQAMSLFRDPSGPARYAKSLDIERFDALRDWISLAGADQRIDATEYTRIIERAAQLGLQAEIASYLIDDHCRKHNLFVEKPAVKSTEKRIQCPVCAAFSAPDAKHCNQCAAPLKVNCPRCSHPSSSITQACAQCGFHLGNMPNALSMLEKARLLWTRRKGAEARKLLSEAETYWPGHPEITALKQKIESQMHLINQERLLFEQLMASREFQTAGQQLTRLQENHPDDPYLSLASRQIRNALEAAEALCTKARSTPNIQQRNELYLEALAHCSDYNEAIQNIAHLPVHPPRNLTAQRTHERTLLQWQAPEHAVGLKYRILRKTFSPPLHNNDGEFLDETSNLQYSDNNAIAGVPFFYAVFSSRARNLSSVTVLADPVILPMEEVSQLKVSLVSGDLFLEWQWPEGISRVQINWRPQVADGIEGTGESAVAFTHHEYAREKGFRLRSPLPADYFFRVRCCRIIDQQEIYSAGQETWYRHLGLYSIEYRLKKNRWWGPRYLLVLRCSHRTLIPPLRVIMKSNAIPLHSGDGVCIAQYHPQKPLRSIRIALPPQFAGKGQFIRLFADVAESQARFRILMPPRKDSEMF